MGEPKREHHEAIVVIEGVQLTEAQSGTIRIAVAHFLVDLADRKYCRELGPIADAYRDRLHEVEDMLIEGANRRSGRNA